MSSVKAIIRKDKINAKGLAPIYLRTIRNRKARLIRVEGVYVHPDDWDQEENKIPYHILERKTKERRLRGKKATYNLRKRIEVQERNSRGYFRIIDVVLGINNTAKKYGVPRSAIYKGSR